MDFRKNIKQKADDLIHKAKVLPDIAINWEGPIPVRCSELKTIEELKARKALDVFEGHKNKKCPAIYLFKIKSKHSGGEIVDALQAFKDKKIRSCPKIDKKRSGDTKFLYCGSSKGGLHGRFIQHLGFGSQNTFALQLFYWANAIQLELEFHYAWLDPNYKEFTELLESALADKIKPLVGKIA